MTREEQIRLNEIIFCNLFKRLLKQNNNPIKVYDFMTALAGVVNASVPVLNNVLTIILNNDKHYLPSRKEYICLLRKSNISSRQAVALAHCSWSTYYSKGILDMKIEPRFDPIQYAEMMKVLKFFVTTEESLQGGDFQ